MIQNIYELFNNTIDMIFPILMVPFALPLMVLMAICASQSLSNGLKSLMVPLKGLWLWIWIFQIGIGFLGKIFFTGNIGIVLTLSIPNFAYLIAFAPSFILSSYKEEMKYYVLNCSMAIISTTVFWILTVSSENWRESGLAFLFIWPALFAMGTITVLVLLVKSNMKATKFKKAILILLGTFVIFSIYKKAERKQVSLEVHNKGKMFDAIAGILLANPSTNINNQIVIKVQEVSAIYKIEGMEIKNKYGGNIIINHNGSDISVTYTGIPKGEPCHNMYFVNSPDYQGFDKIFVNDNPVRKGQSSFEMEKIKSELCNSGLEHYSIKFSGNVENILKRASFRGLRKNNIE